MIEVNKLVRDNIPQLIKEGGKVPSFCKLADDFEFYNELCKKLIEEVYEFVESGDMEEIADILEVIEAILLYKNTAFLEIEEIKEKKASKNGKFKERCFLLNIE